jgi:glycosyltransferase involved in cell wall biosynthesis
MQSLNYSRTRDVSTKKSLKIFVDCTRLVPDGRGGGIKPALLQLLGWCSNTTHLSISFVFVAPASVATELAVLIKPGDTILNPSEAEVASAALHDCDLVYCPFGITDWACPGIPTVTLIVDLLHRDFPETLSSEEIQYREACFVEAVARTNRFEVISDHVGRRLAVHYPSALDRQFRTYLPLHNRLPKLPRYTHIPPYFFYPANAWTHKNHETLLVAYAIYRSVAGSSAWPLILTGHMRGNQDKLVNVCRHLQIENHVEFTGFVDDRTLASRWQHAGALVFPSLHEGFGIPLVEAMAYGVPILASDASAIPEIVGDAALLVSARSPEALAEGMSRISTDAELRSDLVTNAQRQLARFSEAAEFNRLVETFADVAQETSLWQRTGYHSVDGLTDPTSVFALPRTGKRHLSYVVEPLGVPRTLELRCGSAWREIIRVAPDVRTEGKIELPPQARALVMKVPDASRLHPLDPRTHGVLLKVLEVSCGEQSVDLLA